jgi:hypothetical protein
MSSRQCMKGIAMYNWKRGRLLAVVIMLLTLVPQAKPSPVRAEQSKAEVTTAIPEAMNPTVQ